MTARSARDEVLGDIRRALRVEGRAVPIRDAADASSGQLEELVSEIRKDCERRHGELMTQFEAELTRIGGRFYRAANVESAFGYIEQVVSSRQSRSIVAWKAQVIDDIRLHEKLEEKGIECLAETGGRGFVASAASADVGVSGVDYALADTGTLVLLANKGQARSISLLPPVHIAVMRPEPIISGLSDLFPLLRSDARAEGRDLSSAITFITGPSRTADIELTLVVGVHGPQQLHVVLLDR